MMSPTSASVWVLLRLGEGDLREGVLHLVAVGHLLDLGEAHLPRLPVEMAHEPLLGVQDAPRGGGHGILQGGDDYLLVDPLLTSQGLDGLQQLARHRTLLLISSAGT